MEFHQVRRCRTFSLMFKKKKYIYIYMYTHKIGLFLICMFNIWTDVFKKFKNGQGSFNETLASDVQGLCSLYEASHLRIPEDDVLEEACDFSKTKLKSLVKQLSPSVAAQINHCLRRPFYRSLPRFEIRHYMTLFEQDPSHNETLLIFAKVDFNLLQKLHNKEIGHVTK